MAGGGSATGGAGGRGSGVGGLGAKVIGGRGAGLVTGGGIFTGGGFFRPSFTLCVKLGPKEGGGSFGGADGILVATGWGGDLALGLKIFENIGARRSKSAVPGADCSGCNCINNKICRD